MPRVPPLRAASAMFMCCGTVLSTPPLSARTGEAAAYAKQYVQWWQRRRTVKVALQYSAKEGCLARSTCVYEEVLSAMRVRRQCAACAEARASDVMRGARGSAGRRYAMRARTRAWREACDAMMFMQSAECAWRCQKREGRNASPSENDGLSCSITVHVVCLVNLSMSGSNRPEGTSAMRERVSVRVVRGVKAKCLANAR